MVFSLSIFFRNLLRPRVTSVNVTVYENGKEVTVDKYNDFRLAELTKAIDVLWKSSSLKEKQFYWFETEVFEHRSCFNKRPPTVLVTCYKENVANPNLKQKYDIPIRFRHKLFDKKHYITPMSLAGVYWSERMEVKFTTIHK